jgi:hypothetical protein
LIYFLFFPSVLFWLRVRVEARDGSEAETEVTRQDIEHRAISKNLPKVDSNFVKLLDLLTYLGFIGYLLEDLGPAEQFPIVVAGKNVRRP